MGLTENPWVVGIGILIALLGGVPGVIIIWQHFLSKPKIFFTFTDSGLVTADSNALTDGSPLKFLLYSGALFNDGNKECYSVSIHLEGYLGGQLVKGIPELVHNLRQNPNFNNLVQLRNEDSVDFHVLKDIHVKKPIYGSIAFFLKMTPEEYERCKNTFHFIIHDIYGKKFKVLIPIANSPMQKNALFVKTGLVVKDGA